MKYSKRLAQIGSFTNLTIKEPSLNDVFKNLVGHEFEKQATTKGRTVVMRGHYTQDFT